MADTDDTLELTPDLEADEADTGIDEGDQAQASDEGDDGEEIGFGDEAAPASANDTGLVKHLREQIRERDARLAQAMRVPKAELGPRPKSEDFNWDEDRFDEALDAWYARKAEIESAAPAQSDGRDFGVDVRTAHNNFRARFEAMPQADKGQAAEAVEMMLSVEQQATLIATADDSAKLVYALGRNPSRLASLAAIRDPLKLAAAIGKMEAQIVVKPKRTVPAPEKTQSGSARMGTPGTDKELERLQKRADATGDRSELVAYRAKLKTAAKT